MELKAQQLLVERFLDRDLVDKRLRKYASIRKHYGDDLFKDCSKKPPYYCHYLAWRLGTWHNERLFEIFDELLQFAATLPNWKSEFSSFSKSCEFGEYWSLLWQLQMSQFFGSKSTVEWNHNGPDLTVIDSDGPFYVECYSYRKSYGIQEFAEELFTKLDANISVKHRWYKPFSLPQDTLTGDFLHKLFSPYLDDKYLESKKKEAVRSWPVPLSIPDSAENFTVFMEGQSSANYDPSIYSNYTGNPDSYLGDALEKGVANKRDSNQLSANRPNVLAINYLLSGEFQTAYNRQKDLEIETPRINFGKALDAVIVAVCGIDQKFELAELSIQNEPHPISSWMKKYGYINSG